MHLTPICALLLHLLLFTVPWQDALDLQWVPSITNLSGCVSIAPMPQYTILTSSVTFPFVYNVPHL